MRPAVPCCQEPSTLTAVQSPFTKILSLEFYDGPAAGVLQCAACEAVYKFDMLDWDEDHEVRIFRLAPLPPDSLTRCVDIFSRHEEPRWPVWVPSRRLVSSEAAREASDRAVQQILAGAGPPELIVAWQGYGEQILAARRMPAKELDAVSDWFSLEDPASGRDWFSLLSLVKEKHKNAVQPTAAEGK